MNKFKKILLGVASVLTLGALFTVSSVKVNAADISATWNVDSETDTSFAASTEIEDKSFFKIETNSECAYGVLTNHDAATADDGSGLTFNNGLVANGSSTSVSKGIKVTTTENNVTVKFYYTMTDSKFATTTQSKSGNLKISDGTTDLFTSSKTSNKANATAYTDSYTLASAGTIIAYSSGNRLCLFAVSASYEAAGEGQTSITFKDGASDLNTIVYNSGDSIDYLPKKANYTFDGWFTDSELSTPLADDYTVDGTITTLYAKFTENAKYTVTYYIDGELDKTENNVYVGTSITYAPTYENYGFDGWYLDANCDEPISNNYTVNSNISLYGKKVALANYLDSTNMSVHSGGAVNHYNNTIFNFVDKGTEIQIEANTGVVLPNGERCAYRINKANSSAVDNRLITFKAPYDGTVKVWAAAGNAEKNFYICDTTYSTTSYIANQANPAKNELFELTADIVSGKTYAIGGDSRFYIYGIFVEEAPEVEVTPLVQEATDSDYTYVRFVTIVSNAGEISSDDVEFSITMTYTNETTKTVSYTPYVVKKITQNGEAYVANVGTESHTFDNALNATEYYVVYVIRFTTSKFAGCKVSATTTFASVDYTSSQVTI